MQSNSEDYMDIACEIGLFQICTQLKKTVLVMNGVFSYVPGNLQITVKVNDSFLDSHASILPLEHGKARIPHQFEIELPLESAEIKTISLILKDEQGAENQLFTCNEDEIEEHIVETSIIDHIQTVGYAENGIGTIVGWAYSTAGHQVFYEVIDAQENPIDTSVRRTIQQRLLDRGAVTRQNALCGYIISFKGTAEGSYQLVMKDGVTIRTISLDQFVQKNAMSAGKAMHLIKMVNKHNFQRGMRYLKKNGLFGFVKRLSQGVTEDMDYDAWYQRNRVTKAELEEQRHHNFAYAPKISIIVPTFNTPIDLLQEMLESVEAQSYTNWELCIADGSDEGSKTRSIIMAYSQKDERIKVTLLNENYGISGNTNHALQLATGEYTGLFDHDDLLEPDALYEVVLSLQNLHHDIIYTDEDKLNDDTKEFEDPNFKPDYDVDLFLSHNYITHFFVVKTSIINAVGGFDSKYDGSQDYDVMLKCIEKSASIHHIAKILYHWRMHEGSTALDPESKMYCYVAGQNAIQSHLDRIGVPAKVEMQGKPLYGLYHVIYTVPDQLVSIVIPNMDHSDILKTCIDSLFTTNTYQNFEIIVVENNSKEKETFQYYEDVQKQHTNVKVVTWPGKEFNYSAINNYGVTQSHGEYLLFLNNDTEVMKENSLSEMVGLCSRNDVGVVGAKLLYADDTIQHAGVIVGFNGYAGHVFNDIPNGKDYGYMTRDVLNGDLSAVTAACMMTKKSVFTEVNGFDEHFAIACNDIDYCLKVNKAGKLVVYNAFALWHHYESKSRGYENSFEKTARFDQEVEYWQAKWLDILVNGDPYYNKNFKIEDGPFILQ